MLFRHTMMYLPAQLLPPFCQLVALIAWSLRYSRGNWRGDAVHLHPGVLEHRLHDLLEPVHGSPRSEFGETPEGRQKLATVVIGSLLVQIAVSLAIYAITIDRHMTIAMALVLAGLIGGRAVNLFESERSRDAKTFWAIRSL